MHIGFQDCLLSRLINYILLRLVLVKLYWDEALTTLVNNTHLEPIINIDFKPCQETSTMTNMT